MSEYNITEIKPKKVKYPNSTVIIT